MIREPGSVRREGNDLIVVAPPGMPEPTWRTLEQRLTMFHGGVPDTLTTRSLRISTLETGELRHTLSGWPARTWPWVWATDASFAADGAEEVKNSVDNLLALAISGGAADESDVQAENVPTRLAETGFSRVLLPAQVEAVASLLRIGGGGNFSVPGSGKTTMTYALYALMKDAGMVDRMLVVAPQSAYEAWQEEAVACFVEPPAVELSPRSPRRDSEVVVLNYERVSSGATRAAIDKWGSGHRFLVVFDEAHRAKRGEVGLHGRGARDLAGLAARRMVLTGTPMPNGLDDLREVLDLAWPGQGARLASPDTPGAERSWVRITKEHLDLEPARVSIEKVQLDAGHALLYASLVDRLIDDEGGLADTTAARAAIMRLIAVASNPMLLRRDDEAALAWPEAPPLGTSLEQLLIDLPSAALPAKMLAVARHAEKHAAQGTKLLVWTNFVGNVRELEQLLAPYSPAVVTGATPRHDPAARTDRVRELAKFRHDDKCSVLIATPQTLGEGISLHKECQAQIHMDRTFNAGLYLQALDRTHRVGMPAGTTAEVTLLIAEDTIDERIDSALRAKLRDMDAVMMDPTLRHLAGVDVHSDGNLSKEEITRLLAHLRE